MLKEKNDNGSKTKLFFLVLNAFFEKQLSLPGDDFSAF